MEKSLAAPTLTLWFSIGRRCDWSTHTHNKKQHTRCPLQSCIILWFRSCLWTRPLPSSMFRVKLFDQFSSQPFQAAVSLVPILKDSRSCPCITLCNHFTQDYQDMFLNTFWLHHSWYLSNPSNSVPLSSSQAHWVSTLLNHFESVSIDLNELPRADLVQDPF
jgi:hypothetical protein